MIVGDWIFVGSDRATRYRIERFVDGKIVCSTGDAIFAVDPADASLVIGYQDTQIAELLADVATLETSVTALQSSITAIEADILELGERTELLGGGTWP
jgi:multidrug resistance efflux pump